MTPAELGRAFAVAMLGEAGWGAVKITVKVGFSKYSVKLPYVPPDQRKPLDAGNVASAKTKGRQRGQDATGPEPPKE